MFVVQHKCNNGLYLYALRMTQTHKNTHTELQNKGCVLQPNPAQRQCFIFHSIVMFASRAKCSPSFIGCVCVCVSIGTNQVQ